ncbi:type II toxin-antitoxin system VapC family toxin [Pollutimonas sp. M17]|uniref:type II toxin-antitoxin system VapC family toxin n=1 Tax=Pollutimonas sp. M17 TaxID=2962065 RepID=UPI0021F42C45|nr:type II toxin-antitoxin system VapC family toxin [Pollutimonas sp. M17]UYO94990.1 type II toxin-antitoxin system VapC family toxin [Pollutimonas sp. M17]
MILVDTNVLLDIVTDDPVWADWSIQQLESASLRGPLLINDVVYAEWSIGYEHIEALDNAIAHMALLFHRVPTSALFLAGKAFRQYRSQAGTKDSVLPDFFIGAHAAVLDIPLLTRDTGRYRRYFPTLSLITPRL